MQLQLHKLCEEKYGPNHIVVLSYCNQVPGTLYRLGRTQEALPHAIAPARTRWSSSRNC